MTLGSDTGRPIVYLHIGAPKTGTTYLQQRVYANRKELTAAGLHVPGATWGAQVRGVQDIMGFGITDRHTRRASQGAWAKLLDEALASPGQVSLISMEFLGFAGRRKVRRIMSTLRDADVRVILTVRDMAASLPSLWQTLVHNSGRWSWEEFLDAVPEPADRRPGLLGGFGSLVGEFHRTQDVARMLDAWQPQLPPGAVHVVTVPRDRSQPDELWERFAAVLGVDPAAAARPPKTTNHSLGLPSSEVVRLLNLRLGRVSRSEYNWAVKETVALKDLAARAPLEEKAQLTLSAYDVALRWNAATRAAILRSGAVVTGDFSDLPTAADPVRRASLPRVPEPASTQAILDAAEAAAAAFARHARRRRRKLARVGIDVPRIDRDPPRSARTLWQAADDPVDAAARDLADRARENALLLRRIRSERTRGAEL